MSYNNLESVSQIFEARAQRLTTDYWIARVRNLHWMQELLCKLDRIIGAMPDSERNELRRKLDSKIPDNPPEWKEEYDEQFKDLLVEIVGWGWLNKNYPAMSIKFEKKRDEERTWDLSVKDEQDNLIAAMECKAFRRSKEDRVSVKYLHVESKSIKYISDEEQKFLEDHPEKKGDNTAYVPLTGDRCAPFRDKLQDILTNALEQLNASGLTQNKYAYVAFSLNTFLPEITREDIECLIAQQKASLKAQGVELIPFEWLDEAKSL